MTPHIQHGSLSTVPEEGTQVEVRRIDGLAPLTSKETRAALPSKREQLLFKGSSLLERVHERKHMTLPSTIRRRSTGWSVSGSSHSRPILTG